MQGWLLNGASIKLENQQDFSTEENESKPANPFHARLVVEWRKYKAAKTNRM
jgi:hypothetical protein